MSDQSPQSSRLSQFLLQSLLGMEEGVHRPISVGGGTAALQQSLPRGAGTPGLGWAPTGYKALLLGLGRAGQEPKAELWGSSAGPYSQTQG